MECVCTFKNKRGEVVYTTDQPVMAVFFNVATSYGGRAVKTAILCTEIGWEMYLKDSNRTPIGDLADFLAEMSPAKLKAFSELGRYDMLEEFYESIW